MLLTMIVSAIQESCIHFYWLFDQSFGQLLDITPKNFIFTRTFNSEFSYIEAWFSDQNSKRLEVETVTIARNVLIMLSNQPQMHLKLLQNK